MGGTASSSFWIVARVKAEEIRPRSKMCLSRDQLLAENFDPVLVVIVKLAGDPRLAKFDQDTKPVTGLIKF